VITTELSRVITRERSGVITTEASGVITTELSGVITTERTCSARKSLPRLRRLEEVPWEIQGRYRGDIGEDMRRLSRLEEVPWLGLGSEG
jgi:hypothetical protein